MTPRLVKVPAGATDSALHDLIAEAGGFEPGAFVQVDVAHDADCPKLCGGCCHCEPELRIAVQTRQAP